MNFSEFKRPICSLNIVHHDPVKTSRFSLVRWAHGHVDCHDSLECSLEHFCHAELFNGNFVEIREH